MEIYGYTDRVRRYRRPQGRLRCILVLLAAELIIGFLSLAVQSFRMPVQANQGVATPAAILSSPTSRTQPTAPSKPTSKPQPTAPSKPTHKSTPASTPPSTETSVSGVMGYPVFNGSTHVPEIALSFDDGPNPPYTSQILNVLQSYGVPATFFVIGVRVLTYPDLVRQEYEQGNVIGNHTWTHPQLTRLSAATVRSQLQQTSDAIQNAIGVAPTIFRPPYEEFNAAVQDIAASLGLSTVLWNVDPRDWALPGTNAIIANVLQHAHNGAIIELHDGGGYRSETVAALPTIITTLEQRGFRFVTIPRLIEDMRTASGATSQPPLALADSLSIVAVFPCLFACLAERKRRFAIHSHGNSVHRQDQRGC